MPGIRRKILSGKLNEAFSVTVMEVAMAFSFKNEVTVLPGNGFENAQAD